jgi:phage gpG-like protein
MARSRAVVTSYSNRIPDLKGQMRQRVASVARTTAFRIQTRIRLSFAEPKSGREYGKHQASAPGEPPAIDLGYLTNSIQVAMEGSTAYIYTNAKYAPPLEFGSRRMAARPFMLPAAVAEKAAFDAAMKDLL